ncbi:urease accessory protein UreD [Microbaculum marinum]|uniref:Urease accessory protein UreD n=1 Tax=Microbaculum marinum TaxID=1764581 RepID=A0AAW9S090_9HYPH
MASVDATPPALERAEGAVRIGIAGAGGRSHLQEAYQRGSLKVRFPRQFDTDVPEAVLINTAGGITGGDRFRVDVKVSDGASLTITSQAAEKIYRSAAGEGRIEVGLAVGTGAHLLWLPQETILFDRGRLERGLDVDLAEDSHLLLCEMAILGRAAHGETVRDGYLADRWRIRRGGRLVYADNLKIGGAELASAAGPATLGGGRAFANLLMVGPDAEDAVEAARQGLKDAPASAGASAWNGMLAVRMVAADGNALKPAIIRLCRAIGVRVPRAWSI